MSFNKAKIIRFNDIPSPSQAKMNQSKERDHNKVKKPGSVDLHSPVSSERGSIKSVPSSFKTPSLPKKTKTVTSATKTQPKNLFTCDLEALKEKTQECEQKTIYIHKLTEELDQCKHDLENLKLQKEEIQREHQIDIQSLECEMLKIMNKLQKQEEEASVRLKEIEDKLEKETEKLKKSHEYYIGQLVLDYEIKMKDLKEESEEILKKRLEDLENTWEEKLKSKEAESDAILKECQAISEYNIIQCELEKKEIQRSLEEISLEYEKLQKKHEVLMKNHEKVDKYYTNTEKELKDKITKLAQDIEQKDEEIKKLNLEIKAYQLTISNSQTTIEVLKKRLIDSDRDVEQLKQELTRCEEKLINYENRNYCLHLELKEAKDVYEDLELEYELAVKENEESISKLKKELLEKVNIYEQQVKKDKKDKELKEDVMEELYKNIDMIKSINLKVEQIEESLNAEDSSLDTEFLYDKMEQLKQENEDIRSILDRKESTIEELEGKLQILEKSNDDLKEKCEYYKAKYEDFAAEVRENSVIRKKYIDISGKYDILVQDFEALEMQNRDDKEKISIMSSKLERLVEIEEEMEKLKKEKEILQNENLSYKTKFEEQKLKKYKFAAKDKENIGSPNRSVIESPNRGSPYRGSPFRERNN